ncbi:MAG: hypothetical protein KDK24_17200 [Pseudooceanicola sp.]|nr:hypothetical protein [Pseudooceanicola sp.]
MPVPRLLPAGAAVLIAVAAAYVYWSRPSPGFVLLTAEEQSTLARTPTDQERDVTVQASEGPIVKVSAPKGFTLVSPVDFDIRVEPKGGVAVDMTSIKIEYRLGPAWVNMTKRILRYASITGSRLYARGAELPPGKHALRVSINDAQNRLTQATVNFTVSK